MSNHTLINAIIAYNQLSSNQINELYNPQDHSLSNHTSFHQAKSILFDAIALNQKILIYGDYDADGICSTSILFLTLKHLKANVSYYIPNRFNDGYGIQETFVEESINEGVDLFLLVDNGVSAFKALESIQAASKQCIIIDHHSFSTAPEVDAFIHSDYLEAPFDSLCASGLAQQLSEHIVGLEPYYIVLAGIATLADMMPLWGYNRSLVQETLRIINQRKYRHLITLLPKKETYIEDDLIFQLIPKLNAVGRLAEDLEVNDLVKYLSYHNQSVQDSIRENILTLNAKRKTMDKAMYQKALELMNEGSVICVADESFHEGIVGITAGQLARAFKKPAFVFHRNSERLKGSARSYGNQDLITLMEPLKGIIERFGGHSAAAGIELSPKHYEDFKKALSQIKLQDVPLQNTNALVLDESWLSHEVIESLDAFRPFGQAFELPRFLVKNAHVHLPQRVRGGIKGQLLLQGIPLTGLYFNQHIDQEAFCLAKTFLGRLSVEASSSSKRLTLMIDEFY
jgi:single-stranded-DNA-specific exonuclease